MEPLDLFGEIKEQPDVLQNIMGQYALPPSLEDYQRWVHEESQAVKAAEAQRTRTRGEYLGMLTASEIREQPLDAAHIYALNNYPTTNENYRRYEQEMDAIDVEILNLVRERTNLLVEQVSALGLGSSEPGETKWTFHGGLFEGPENGPIWDLVNEAEGQLIPPDPRLNVGELTLSYTTPVPCENIGGGETIEWWQQHIEPIFRRNFYEQVFVRMAMATRGENRGLLILTVNFPYFYGGREE